MIFTILLLMNQLLFIYILFLAVTLKNRYNMQNIELFKKLENIPKLTEINFNIPKKTENKFLTFITFLEKIQVDFDCYLNIFHHNINFISTEKLDMTNLRDFNYIIHPLQILPCHLFSFQS